jgi:hypothetical protein
VETIRDAKERRALPQRPHPAALPPPSPQGGGKTPRRTALEFTEIFGD